MHPSRYAGLAHTVESRVMERLNQFNLSPLRMHLHAGSHLKLLSSYQLLLLFGLK